MASQAERTITAERVRTGLRAEDVPFGQQENLFTITDRGEDSCKLGGFPSFALFSGGHDSLCSTHYAMSNGLAEEVVHINTGIGIAKTREFVRDTCAEHGWTLNEIAPPVSYDEIVLTHGFPGPGAHSITYRRLKERALAAFARERKNRRGQPFTYLTGVRQSESVRRMAHVSEWQPAPKLGWTWFAPIFDWTKADCNTYIEKNRLRRNEVVDVLHMSGECLCGSFAKRIERAELARWYPETLARISALEAEAERRGIDSCVWGQSPPDIAGQQRLNVAAAGMLCVGCSA